MKDGILIFIPTYNEAKNAPLMCGEIGRQSLDADLLFIDDGSPDGTGKILEDLKAEFPRLVVRHRAGKLGIGSAHAEAIQWAYEQGYRTLVTLDCDFTHSPSDIPRLLQESEGSDVVVGSRWINKDSLPGWNLFRLTLTRLGRFLTKTLLGIPQDASGAFRVYRLDRIPREIFNLPKSKGYPFFFESLFVFNRNGLKVREVPIVLPARTYGNSKMSAGAATHSAWYILELLFESIRKPERFLLAGRAVEWEPGLVDPQNWDGYWNSPDQKPEGESGRGIYDFIAGLYRRWVIRRNLEAALRRVFPDGACLLHAGCGSGQVDAGLHDRFRITALDISTGALQLYARNNPGVREISHGSIFRLPFPDGSFDGIYNLGVMEHFTVDEITRILAEFHRVLKPRGRMVLFWPHVRATSVFVLGLVHFVMGRIPGLRGRLHPPEITHCRGKQHARDMLGPAGFRLAGYRFGPADGFVQAVIHAEKN